MTMETYVAAAELLRSDSRADFVGARERSLIDAAERRLDFRFPPTYRRFLLEFGCGNIGGQEIYGLIDEPIERGPIPNAVWLNLQRRARGWKPSLFVIHESGDGTSHALSLEHTGPHGEASVWLLSVSGESIEKVADDFGDFLLSLVQRQSTEPAPSGS